jgi:hypothetical protein
MAPCRQNHQAPLVEARSLPLRLPRLRLPRYAGGRELLARLVPSIIIASACVAWPVRLWNYGDRSIRLDLKPSYSQACGLQCVRSASDIGLLESSSPRHIEPLSASVDDDKALTPNLPIRCPHHLRRSVR